MNKTFLDRFYQALDSLGMGIAGAMVFWIMIFEGISLSWRIVLSILFAWDAVLGWAMFRFWTTNHHN